MEKILLNVVIEIILFKTIKDTEKVYYVAGRVRVSHIKTIKFFQSLLVLVGLNSHSFTDDSFAEDAAIQDSQVYLI